MAKISLRAYLREIDHLIDSAGIDEAIAHCRYILQIYPKEVATYRLLGKAYLEKKRYADAADILQRVLSSVPDDFVSHIGMSIIREDEGNLDAAIWHMERAFESQPSNLTIQDELKRLYGRRDGIQPPKIHLTRGALARMYARGSLYQQAISELRAALAEDPQRPDLQVLLARMYLQTGQRLESAETCSTLLSKLPYCLEANQILAQILPGTERAGDAQAYLQRVQALDPYAAFTSPQIPAADQVPDAAISIDKYDGSIQEQIPSISEQPDWATSLGVDVSDLTPVGKGLPEWLSSPLGETPPFESEVGSFEGTPATQEDTSFVEPEHELEPEIRMEGAEETISEDGTGEEGESPIPFDFEGESPEGLEPGEIPEWLRSMAPPKAGAEGDQAAYQPDFLKEQAPEQGEEIPGWLQEIGEGQPVDDQSDLFTRETPEGEPEMPAWLQDIGAGVPGDIEEQIPEEEEILVDATPFEADEEQLSEWLSTETSGAIESPEVPEWLKQMSEASQEESEPTPEEEVEATADETPQVAAELPEVEDLGQQPEEEQIPEWMQEEADQSGEEFETPEWLQSMSDESAKEEQPPVPEPELVETFDSETAEPPEIETASISDLDREDQESALAWLEGLAAKQGAPEEELFSSPEERFETPPEWLSKFSQEMVAGEFSEEPSPLEAGEIEEEPLHDWLQAASLTEVESDEEAESLPEWLSAMEGESPPEGIQEPIESTPLEADLETESVSTEPPGDFDIPEWLSGIGEEAESGELEIGDWTTEADQEVPSMEEIAPQLTSTPESGTIYQVTEMIEGDTQPVRVTPEIPEEEASWSEDEIVSAEPLEVVEPFAPQVETEIQAEQVPFEEEVEPQTPAITGSVPESIETPEWVGEESIEPAPQEPPIVPTTEAEEIEELEQIPEWLQEFEEEEPEEYPPTAVLEELEVPPEEIIEVEEVTEIEVQPEEPEEEEPPVAAIPESIPHIPINSASFSQLEHIPGIGSVTAKSIVTYRQTNGPFTSLEQLQNVPGIGPVILENFKNWLEVDVVEEEQAITQDPALQRLAEARNALVEENLHEALDCYVGLVEEGKLLDDIIPDLEEMVAHQPQNLDILQLLGDAYLRGDHLQKALDAYTKAEELLQ